MRDIVITPDQLAECLDGILEDYKEEIFKGIKSETKKTMKRMVKLSKADAPKRQLRNRAAGTYANHITSKVSHQSFTGYSELWYVKPPEYVLTHLLNNGHALHQGGRYEGSQWLTKISEEEKRSYERNVKQVIADASR